MDPIALIALAGMVFTAKKLAKKPEPETYRTGHLADMPDYSPPDSHVARVDFLNGEMRPVRDQGLTISPPRFNQARKQEIRGFQPGTSGYHDGPHSGPFQVIAPNTSQKIHGLTSDDYREIGNQYTGLNKIVMNNVNPIGNKVNVGPGLGVGPTVPAAGNFHQGGYRILQSNPNDQNLQTLPPVNPSGAGRAQVPHTALAAGPVSGYTENGIYSYGVSTTQPLRQTDMPHTGAPGGGKFYVAAPDSAYVKGNLPTLKDQTLYSSMGGASKFMVPAAQAYVNKPGVSGSAVNTTYTHTQSNRGQETPYMSPGLSSRGQTDPGQLTTVINDTSGIHPGNPSFGGTQYINSAVVEQNPYKGAMNPRGPNNSYQQAAMNNPFVIPSFAAPK